MKYIIIGLVCLFLIGIVNAESIGIFEQGENVELYQTCNNCTYCNFTRVMNNQNSTILTNIESVEDGDYFYYVLDGGNTTTYGLGVYTYCYSCGNEVDKETGCLDFKVTSTGEDLELSQGIILLAQLGFIGLLFGIGRTFKQEKWKLKLFFDVCALFMGVILLNSLRIIASNSENLGSMAQTGLYLGLVILLVMLLYLFIYALIEIFTYFKGKKEARWRFNP